MQCLKHEQQCFITGLKFERFEIELSTGDKISTVGVFNSFKNGPGVFPFYRNRIMLLKSEN